MTTTVVHWLQQSRALLWRDLWQWRWLPLAALALGLLPIFVAAWQPTTTNSTESVRQATVLIVLGSFGPLMLVTLGATMFGRDLTERRFDFYLVRPLGAWLLWSVRVFAAWLVSVVSLALLVLPILSLSATAREQLPQQREYAIPWSAMSEYFSVSQLLTEQHYPRPAGLPWALMLLLSALLAVILVAHVVSISLRSRSTWLLLDAVGALIVMLLLLRLREQMIGAEAFGLMVWLERGLMLAVPAVFWLAGGLQLARGRGDLTRGHRIQALVIWPSLLLLTLALSAVAGWASAPKIDDLEGFEWAHQSPQDGRWLAVGGVLRGRAGQQGVFLLDTESGESSYLGGMISVAPWLRFAPDGSRVLWLRCRRFGYSECEFWTRDLLANSAARSTGIKIGDLETEVELSPAGDLVALGGGQRLEVHALAAGRLVAALQTRRTFHLSFRRGGTLRFVSGATDSETNSAELMELELGSRKVRHLGSLPADLDAPSGLLSPDGDLLFSRSLFPYRLQIVDMTNSDLVCDLRAVEAGIPGHVGGAMFLSRHQLALLSADSPLTDSRLLSRRWLSVIEVQGDESGERFCRPARVVELPAADRAFFGALVAPAGVTLGMRIPGATGKSTAGPLEAVNLGPLEHWQTMLVELDDLEISKLADGFVPFSPGHQAQPEPLRPLFLAADRGVFRWQPSVFQGRLSSDPGQAEVLLPPSPRGVHSGRVHF